MAQSKHDIDKAVPIIANAAESSSVKRRRQVFAALVLVTVTAMAGLMAATLAHEGYNLLDLVLITCFLVTLPWTVVGFWNALIGLFIMRAHSDPARYVCPIATRPDDDSFLTDHTAILMCIRNEDALKVARHLDLIVAGLVEANSTKNFHLYVLSDSSSEENRVTEQTIFERLRDRWQGILPVTYRCREHNVGYKAGNIRDFCDRWGTQYDHALVLDADSFMSSATILRMVRTMQNNPRLGILQSLPVGMPTVSPFARAFQFGMRLGMRSYTLGSAWWQADCGPYWGHNALIRLRPFIQHCQLPQLPANSALGRQILSHDQFEAALMRKAGYDVRVLAEEGGSWEENPPTLLEFIRRDLRWCHGNMQYLWLLKTPGLRTVSRIQLLLAILMYLGSPAWIALVTLGTLQLGLSGSLSETYNLEMGWILLACILAMVFAPKLATLAQVLSSTETRRAFGGPATVLLSTLCELVLSMLLAPVVAFAHTRFLMAIPFGRIAGWAAQRRSAHELSVVEAIRYLWAHSLFGAAMVIWVLYAAPTALTAFAPFVVGFVLAVPIAVLTSWGRLGELLARLGLWRIPDESAPAPELEALGLEALHRSRQGWATSSSALRPASQPRGS